MIPRTAILSLGLAAALAGCGERLPAGASDGRQLVTADRAPASPMPEAPEPAAEEMRVAPLLDTNGNEIDAADAEVIREELERQDAERSGDDDWGSAEE